MADLYTRTRRADEERDTGKAKSEGLWLYLGGKMNGVQDFGFLAFDAGRDLLTAHPEVGEVFSPADNDRINFGFEGIGKDGHPSGAAGQRRHMLTQDMAWIGRWSDGMVVLDGWEDSPGTRAEVGFHQGLFLPVWRLGDFLAAGAAADPIPLLGSVQASPASAIRSFETGATRDRDEHKHNYAGFLSLPAIRVFGAYMHKHRTQPDGTVRDGGNWKRGMPKDAYVESAWRHFLDWCSLHEGYETSDFAGNPVTIEDALCGLLFNVQGYLHTIAEGRLSQAEEPRP